MKHGQDPVLSIVDELCRERGYRKDKGGPGEGAIAELVASKLRAFPWLTVMVEHLGDEIYNVLAFDGDPSEVELLIVGHLDTVIPSSEWTREEFSDDGTFYYALGANDTRGGIAAALDAIGKAGRTSKVGYLFYGDEEYQFVGMKEFVRTHPDVAPRFGLSVCGGKAEAYLGWRACTEIELLFRGVPGHASRPWAGANAAEAVSRVTEAVRRACAESVSESGTAVNIAAIHAGSFSPPAFVRKDADSPFVSYDFERDYRLGKQESPPLANVANKIPDMAWALMDIRPGGKGVTAAFMERVAQEELAAFNAGREHRVTMEFHVNFEMPAYEADRELIRPMFDLFLPVHAGKSVPTASTGFVDVTLISGMHGTQFMCLSPAGARPHSGDESVKIASLLAYRDCIVSLLSGYKAPNSD